MWCAFFPKLGNKSLGFIQTTAKLSLGKIATVDRKVDWRKVVNYLRYHQFTLLTSDKEGGFVGLHNKTFSKKDRRAIEKHYKPSVTSRKTAGAVALMKLNELDMVNMVRSVE